MGEEVVWRGEGREGGEMVWEAVSVAVFLCVVGWKRSVVCETICYELYTCHIRSIH